MALNKFCGSKILVEPFNGEKGWARGQFVIFAP